jgi:hypothetical protein
LSGGDLVDFPYWLADPSVTPCCPGFHILNGKV